MAERVVKLMPSFCVTPPNVGGGCGVLPMPPSRARRPPAARAVAKNRPGAAENAASTQNLSGLPNGTADQRNTRKINGTNKQLYKPDLAPKHLENIHHQLYMVDVLEKIGISRHFAGETKSILDVIYSCWLHRDGEIMLDTEICAMAFRILRMNGYDVSSDYLFYIVEASRNLKGTRSLLELYKASQVIISEDELILDTIGSWSGRLLEEQLSSSASQRTTLLREVEHALNSPFYTTLDRLEHKRNIEQLDTVDHQMLHLPRQINQDLLALCVMDFNTSQSIYQQELEILGSWVKESKLDQLPFARQKLAYFYLSAAGTMFSVELSDARMFWAMNGVLTTVVDDFFDVGGSKEELENLTALVQMWKKHEKTVYYSRHVEIVFSAIYSSVNQLGAKASVAQGRDVTEHVVEIWQDLLRNMMTEVEWRESRYVPTPKEYMDNAVVTFALGPIVLPALYFVGAKIMESATRDAEYIELFRLMSTCGRLLNDVQTYEREYSQGKLNSVSLLVLQSGGSLTIQEARKELQKTIGTCKRDLLRLVPTQAGRQARGSPIAWARATGGETGGGREAPGGGAVAWRQAAIARLTARVGGAIAAARGEREGGDRARAVLVGARGRREWRREWRREK